MLTRVDREKIFGSIVGQEHVARMRHRKLVRRAWRVAIALAALAAVVRAECRANDNARALRILEADVHQINEAMRLDSWGDV